MTTAFPEPENEPTPPSMPDAPPPVTLPVDMEPPTEPAATPLAAQPATPAAPTLAASVPPQAVIAAPKPTHTADGKEISSRSRLIMVLLCFFLGGLGIHSFYAGKNTNGIIQIVITVVTLGTLGWVWPLIDFIMLLMGTYMDDEGKPVINWET